MDICVIIPTYNEAASIADLVKSIRGYSLDVLVIDDGSLDDTSVLAEKNGATVIINPFNQGKGASLIKGFQYAMDKDYDAVITMDGDGQHSVSDIPYFIRLAGYSDSGVLIGNRMINTKNMPLIRFATNKFLSFLISFTARQLIPDTQCGFRLIKREVLEKINLTTYKYETETEILLQASSLGFKIESIPVKTIYEGQASRINPLVDTWRFICFISKKLWLRRYPFR
ncbi:MAG: glycosyltransferase family 2 protein [Candidatus Omnitrophota bacterium]